MTTTLTSRSTDDQWLRERSCRLPTSWLPEEPARKARARTRARATAGVTNPSRRSYCRGCCCCCCCRRRNAARARLVGASTGEEARCLLGLGFDSPPWRNRRDTGGWSTSTATTETSLSINYLRFTSTYPLTAHFGTSSIYGGAQFAADVQVTHGRDGKQPTIVRPEPRVCPF